jgi:acetoin utilization deacetylase AcuC-like enzyme
MITVFTEDHRLHHGTHELIGGQLVPPVEDPSRLDQIIAHLRKVQFGEVIGPRDFGLDPIRRVHTERFIDFMRTAHAEWCKVHGDTDALPLCWPSRTFQQIEPETIDGRLSYFSFDAGTPITSGTWLAITSAVNVAMTGVELIRQGEHAVFALCRPPGHHAAGDLYGGYCFFNNAAIAAQALIDRGAERVVILDVDYHHGNGTQAIFYDRADVLYLSLHAHPAEEFPFFLGYANETGVGRGEGFNRNFPMRRGTEWLAYRESLKSALAFITDFAPDVLIVSLGVDTFEKDPISHFKLRSDDYLELGSRIGRLSLPTLFVMEGGYAVDEICINVVNVLTSFEGT